MLSLSSVEREKNPRLMGAGPKPVSVTINIYTLVCRLGYGIKVVYIKSIGIMHGLMRDGN